MRKTFPLIGMHCSSCVSKVESILNNFKGIEKSRVNIGLKTISFIMDDSANLHKLSKLLLNEGYELSIDKRNLISEFQKKEAQEWKFKFIISSIFGIPLLVISMWDMFNNAANETVVWILILQLVLSTIVILVCNSIFYIGFNNLLKFTPDMNSLIALGTSAAYIYSLFSFININIGSPYPEFTDIYFESAGVILLFISIGRFLESKAREKTTNLLTSLFKSIPVKGIVKRNDKWIEVAADEIEKGDLVKIKPGSKIPVDGIITEGASEVDESSITGESVPVKKKLVHM